MMGMIKKCAPYAATILVQIAYGGSNILTKVSLDKGQNQFVFIVYRHLIGMLVLGPLAYALERKQQPSLSYGIVVKIFVLASLGATIQLNVFYAGLEYTTATVASALSNVIPALTFLLAILFGMEKVMIQSVKGRAKMLGMLICISGALVFTFWKGGYLFKSLVPRPLINVDGRKNSGVGLRHHKDDWVKGSLLILASKIAWCAWLLLQAAVCKVYTSHLTINTLICFFASLQSFVLALIFDRKLESWKLEWNVQLLTIIYTGILNSAFAYYLQTWVISEKGPVFWAMFSPLLVLVVGIFSAFAFAERLHLGSLIGALLIIIGLYCVLWGKSKDSSTTCGEGKLNSTSSDPVTNDMQDGSSRLDMK